jgi:predicted O-methyltransferase YrrM
MTRTPLASRIFDRFSRLATAAGVYRLLWRQSRSFAEAGADLTPIEDLLSQTEDGRLLEIRGHQLEDVRVSVEQLVASQKYEELVAFLAKMRDLHPRRVCEIGTSAGGTLYAFTRVAAPDAVIVAVDLELPAATRHLRGRLGRENQTIVGIEGDSREPATKQAVKRALGGEPLDVLFIDGDHSYDGVKSDFELYGPLVRVGGLIGIHDINEDYATRHGRQTPSISGEVPRFWRELNGRYRTEELIAEPEQDGYGIGVVYV